MKIRTIVFACLVSITVGLCVLFPGATNMAESGMVMWLPTEFEGFRGYESEVGEAEKSTLPGDTSMLKMVYIREGVTQETFQPDDQVAVTLLLQGADKRSLHRPEICLVGQGWTVIESVVVPIMTSGGTLEVRDLHLSRKEEIAGGEEIVRRAHYVYWWVGKEFSTPHVWQRAWAAFENNVFHNLNDRWGYPSVMVHVNEEKGPKANEMASEQAYSYIEKLAPKFMKVLGAQEQSWTRELQIGK